jgi:hypothetical protein
VKNVVNTKNGLGTAHPALCSTVLETSYSITATQIYFLTYAWEYTINIMYICFFFFSYISTCNWIWTDLFFSSLKSSVTDFGCSFFLFSDRMTIIVARWSSYSLQSRMIWFSVWSPCGNSFSWLRNTLYPQKLALTSPTSGCRSVCIVRLRSKVTEFIFSLGSFSHVREIPMSQKRCLRSARIECYLDSWHRIFI